MGFIFSFEQSFLNSVKTIIDFWTVFCLFKLEAVLDDYKGPRRLTKEIWAVNFDCKKILTMKTWIWLDCLGSLSAGTLINKVAPEEARKLWINIYTCPPPAIKRKKWTLHSENMVSLHHKLKWILNGVCRAYYLFSAGGVHGTLQTCKKTRSLP